MIILFLSHISDIFIYLFIIVFVMHVFLYFCLVLPRDTVTLGSDYKIVNPYNLDDVTIMS